ncbi:MAG: PEP-CTERM sorting domain-containing protein [Planctomycetia bacterium]|nr:PEP-CTERM sorting domain-containing protein [Planctomycetia bacterium]
MIGSLRAALQRDLRRYGLGLGMLLSLSAAGGTLRAADVSWQGDDAVDPTNWTVGNNWDLGSQPAPADNAIIGIALPATISSDVGFIGEVHVRGGGRLNMVAGGKISPDGAVFIGDEAGSTGEYVQTGGVVDAFTNFNVGVNGGTGHARLTGGQLLYNSPDGFGQDARFHLGVGGVGTFDLEGGELRQVAGNPENAWNYIGQGDGEATFNISGGVASFLGRTHVSDGAAQATVNQTGGLFEVRNHELIISDVGTGGGKGTYNISGGQLKVATNIAIGHWTNSNGEMNVSGTADVQLGNELHVGGGDDAGNPAVGVLNQSGGNIRGGGWGYIGGPGAGTNAGGHGTFNLSGGTFTNANRLHVAGENGSEGVLNQTGGTLRVEAVYDAANAIINTPDMLIGDGRGSTGVYNLSGGSAVIDREMLLGHWANTDGTVNVSGTGNLQIGGPLRVGGYTNNDAGADGLPFTADDAAGFNQPNLGKFNQSAGVVKVAGDYSIGSGFNSTGVQTMSGGTLEIGGWTRIGDQEAIVDGTQYKSTGTFNMTGGEATFHSRMGIGFGGTGTINQTGGRMVFDDASANGISFTIGDSFVSKGTYNLSGGEVVVSAGRVQIGHWHTMDATMNVSGTGVLRTLSDVHVASESDGPANKGVLNQSGGMVDVGGNLIVAFHAAGTGDINLSAGELHSRQNVLVGDAGLGTITQTGGTHIVEGDLTIGVQATSDGLYTLDGGVLDMTGGSMSYGAGLAAQFAFEGGTLKNAGTINFDLVNSGGTLAPGASPGTTNIIGAYTITNASANYQVELAGTTQGTGYDFLNVSGIATLGGKLEVLLASSGPVLGDTDADNDVDITDLNNVRNNFAGAGLGDTDDDGDVDITDLNNVRNNFGGSSAGFVPNVGDSFTVLTAAGGRVGTFASTSLPVLPAGRAWGAVQYLPNDVRLNVVASPVPVPEPGTLGLGCVLLAGAGWWVRRQKRR